MKQEFIIGDIVMYKNRIHTIIDILASNGYELSYVRHPVSPVRLSGVPLTPEILEKNGWEFVGGQVDEDGFTWDIYSNRGVLPDLYYYPDGKFSVFMYRKEVLPDIKYIHQLQHFLYGLGLNSEMEVQVWK